MPNLIWAFYLHVTWINRLLMRHKLINFDWIVNNLIVHNLLIPVNRSSCSPQFYSCFSLKKSEAAASRCTSWYLVKFRNIQRKTPVLESVFNKVAGMQLSCEYLEIFRNSFFHKTPAVVASEKFMNFPGKHQWRRGNRFIFSINTTE